MTKANGRILGSVIALSLVMGATGTAHAGLNLQGLNLQGLNLQGLNLQGLNLQGLNLLDVQVRSVSLGNVLLSSGKFANGVSMSNPSLWQGNQLRAYNGPTLIQDTALIGSTLQGALYLSDGVTTLQKGLTLTISNVVSDTITNSMICDPQVGQYQSNCGLGYNQNYGIKLYKLTYKVNESGQTGNLCGGDGLALLLKGEWDESGEWSDDGTGKITASCTSGVVTKCARNWGYKPWKTMIDKYGNSRDMRDYHQACTRAARADYSGTGHPYTMTGVPVDMFDNGGFNVPSNIPTLQTQGFTGAVRFESFFTFTHQEANSPKTDAWGSYLSDPRLVDMLHFDALYGYTDVDWGEETPKQHVYFNSPTTWLTTMANNYQLALNNNQIPKPEITVFTPIWSAVGQNVQSGDTVDSLDHFTPTCASSTAPDRGFMWTAPQAGNYQFDTISSKFDTVIYIWDNQHEVACNDDIGTNGGAEAYRSLVTYTMTAGQTVTVFVDGFGAQHGSFQLNITKL